MKRLSLTTLSVLFIPGCITLLIWSTNPPAASAHCQIPCGIYDDDARIARLREDAVTISKAINQINLLHKEKDIQAINQITRWINNKESHASHIIQVVSEYFLTQKVKTVAPGAEGYDAYLKKLADHHAVMVAAMKTKQNTTDQSVAALNQAIDTLSRHYHIP